jgi:hypothetical protein
MHEQVRQFAGGKAWAQDAQRAACHVRPAPLGLLLDAMRLTQPTPPGGVPDAVCVVVVRPGAGESAAGASPTLSATRTSQPVASRCWRIACPISASRAGISEIVTSLLARACATARNVPLATQRPLAALVGGRHSTRWAIFLRASNRVEQLLRLVGQAAAGRRLARSASGLPHVNFRATGAAPYARLSRRSAADSRSALRRSRRARARALERYGQAGYFLDAQTEFLIGVANINDAESADAQEFLRRRLRDR